MKRLILVLALLGGCITIPADAVQDDYPELPGAVLSAWQEQGENAVQWHGVFDNDSGRSLLVYNGYHLGAWNVTLENETGAAMIFNPRLSCRDYDYSQLADKEQDTLTYTWDYRVFDDLDVCKSGHEPPARRAEAGNYTVIIQYQLARQPDDAFEVRLPLLIS